MILPLLAPSRPIGRKITYLDTATSTAITITVPSGVQDDDLCVLADMAWAGIVPTNVVPTGFTQLGTATSGGTRLTLSWKKLVDADASSSLTGMNGTVGMRKRLLVFRPNRGISNWAYTDGQLTTTVADPAAVTTQASLASDDCVAMGFALSDNSVTATGWSPDDADGDTGSGNARALYNIFSGAGVDHTLDMADYGAVNGAAAVTMEIT